LFGIELVDVEEFACCGFPVRSFDEKMSLLLAARDLAIAEDKGLDICTICSGCTAMLTEVSHKLQSQDMMREEANTHLREIGRTFKGTTEVKHFARVLYDDIGIDGIKNKVTQSLQHLTIASHYGCHYLKPSSVFEKFEDPEFPRTLDSLVSATGAKIVDYEEKTMCCGGNILDVNEKISLTMAGTKLNHIKEAAPDAINLVCPLCSVMYDRNQRIIERTMQRSYNLPVLFYPQLLGLAMGLKPSELGLDLNRVRTAELVAKL